MTKDAVDITALTGWAKTRWRYTASVVCLLAGAQFLVLSYFVFRDGWFGLGVACLGVSVSFLVFAVSWTLWVSGHPRLGTIARWEQSFAEHPRHSSYTIWAWGVALIAFGIWLGFPGSGAPSDPNHSGLGLCLGFGAAALFLGWVFYRYS